MENKTYNLIKFGIETLGYKKESGANTYFKKKINTYFELNENNNTCTLKEIMTFAKEKASKTSKLMVWYNKELEKLLADVFVEKAEEGIKRETYTIAKKTKTTTNKKDMATDYNKRLKNTKAKTKEVSEKEDKETINSFLTNLKKEVVAEKKEEEKKEEIVVAPNEKETKGE